MAFLAHPPGGAAAIEGHAGEAPAGTRARYVCVIAHVDPDTGAEHLIEGRCEGTLALQPRGTGGVGPLQGEQGSVRELRERVEHLHARPGIEVVGHADELADDRR